MLRKSKVLFIIFVSLSGGDYLRGVDRSSSNTPPLGPIVYEDTSATIIKEAQEEAKDLQPFEKAKIEEKFAELNRDGEISDQEANELLESVEEAKAKSQISSFSSTSTTSGGAGIKSFFSGMGGSGLSSLGKVISSLPTNLSHGTSSQAPKAWSSNLEGFEETKSILSSSIDAYQSAFKDFSFSMGNTALSDGFLAKTRDLYIDRARDILGVPRDNDSSLEDNTLFRALNMDSKQLLKPNFSGLIKNAAMDASPVNDLPYLKDLIKNDSFQKTAIKVLGKDSLNYLNYSTVGADLLNSKAMSGANYATMLKLMEGTSGLKPSAFVLEWLEAARFISSNTYLNSMKDPALKAAYVAGYAELDQVVKALTAYKSLDLLDSIVTPMKVNIEKMGDAAVISAISALRSSSKQKPRDVWDPDTRSNFDFYLENLEKTAKEIVEVNNKQLLVEKFHKLLSNNSVRAYWRIFDLPNYFKFRRSVAVLYFSESFKDFKTPQPQNKGPLFTLVKASMDYVKDQEQRTLARQKKEIEEEQSVAIGKLASDAFYPKLEEERD